MTLADIRELVLAADPDACAYESGEDITDLTLEEVTAA